MQDARVNAAIALALHSAAKASLLVQGSLRPVVRLCSRCKQSGMFWGEPGAEDVLALRCIQISRRLGEFWRGRLNTHAACNDSFALAA